jgi:hypothetical protein
MHGFCRNAIRDTAATTATRLMATAARRRAVWSLASTAGADPTTIPTYVCARARERPYTYACAMSGSIRPRFPCAWVDHGILDGFAFCLFVVC